jgi:hypothetical protein
VVTYWFDRLTTSGKKLINPIKIPFTLSLSKGITGVLQQAQEVKKYMKNGLAVWTS